MFSEVSAVKSALSDKNLNVCFSGYRPAKLPSQGDENSNDMILIVQKLDELIIDAKSRGKINFINGLMSGFDVVAAEAVIRLKSTYPQIKLFSIEPFHEKYFQNRNWTPAWIRRALSVFCATDYGIRTADEMQREHWMIF